MDDRQPPKVVSAERQAGNVVITFDDGQCATYSAALLYAALPQAEIFIDTDSEEEKQPD